MFSWIVLVNKCFVYGNKFRFSKYMKKSEYLIWFLFRNMRLQSWSWLFDFTSHLSDNLWSIAHFALLYYATPFQPSRSLIFPQENGLDIARRRTRDCWFILYFNASFYVRRKLHFYIGHRSSHPREILCWIKYGFSKINNLIPAY